LEDGCTSIDAHVVEEFMRRNKSGYVRRVKDEVGKSPLSMKDTPRLSTTRGTNKVDGRELGDEGCIDKEIRLNEGV
jgi:hypothetical protein